MILSEMKTQTTGMSQCEMWLKMKSAPYKLVLFLLGRVAVLCIYWENRIFQKPVVMAASPSVAERKEA